MSTTIKRQSIKVYHHSTTGLFKVFFNFLSSQTRSDGIPPKVKLDDVKNAEMGKANKRVKMQTQILFKLSGSMFFKWKQ